jgi:YegS/Rv2252/BmrU family lipid kinase
MKKLLWIVNPVSRPGRTRRSIPVVEDLLRRAGYDVEISVTQTAGDPQRIAAEAAKRAEVLLVAGGDGTVSEVLNALTDDELPLGFIPLGTTNVYARELGIPLDPVAAAQAFLKGRPRSFDLGLLGDQRFLIMASYGFDAWAVRHTSLRIKKVLGRYIYPLTGILGFPFYRPEPIEIIPEDGSEPVVATFAVFSNARRYAGEFIAAPDADMHDGLLDVVCWTKGGRLGAAMGVVNLFLGRLAGKPWLKIFQAPSVRFSTKRPECFQVDGDPADGTSGRIEIRSNAFRLIVPSA